jgi:hypothetical protein
VRSLICAITTRLGYSVIYRPIAFKKGTNNELHRELTENPYPTWQKLEEMVEKGKIRNIGISKCVPLSRFLWTADISNHPSFNTRRIQNLTANPLKIKPAINQVELNFWNPQPDLIEVCPRSMTTIKEFNGAFASHMIVVQGAWNSSRGVLPARK